jgi:hypothetical protein
MGVLADRLFILRSHIETPILLVGLSPKVSFKQKLWCGAWLNACTYPNRDTGITGDLFRTIPSSLSHRRRDIAPVGECLLFWTRIQRQGYFRNGRLGPLLYRDHHRQPRLIRRREVLIH